MNHLTTDILNLYLDDQLDEADRRSVEAHLVACPTCQRELADLRDLFAEIAALPPVVIPVDLTAAVLDRVRPQPWRAPLLWLIMLAQFGLTAALVLWLAPTLAGQIQVGQVVSPAEAVAGAFSTLANWVASQLLPLQAALSSVRRAAETFSLTASTAISPLQWGIMLGIGVLIWLVGNRLLFVTLAQEQQRQEAA